MKAKLLLMLLLVVSIGSSVYASNHKARKMKYKTKEVQVRNMRRSSFDPTIQVNETNGILLLTFQYSLHDADITIIDKDGNEVIKEQQSIIYEGRIISIPMADAYPYSIEITSPTVDIEGEIVLEE